jgi:hypothetical protein
MDQPPLQVVQRRINNFNMTGDNMSFDTVAKGAANTYRAVGDAASSFAKNNPGVTGYGLVTAAGLLGAYKVGSWFNRTAVAPFVGAVKKVTNKVGMWWFAGCAIATSLLLRLLALVLGAAAVEPVALVAGVIFILVFMYLMLKSNKSEVAVNVSALEHGKMVRIA